MNSDLKTAIDRADLREIIADLYPDANVNPSLYVQRIAAVWRGGDNPEAVKLTAEKAHDFKEREAFDKWSFLARIAGFSKAQAAAYLLRRAGLDDTPQGQRKAARRVVADKRRDDHAEAVKARVQAAALAVQRTAPTEGVSCYLERKGVAELFTTHRVAPAKLANGETVPGLVYSADDDGPFIQLVLRDLEGNVTGFQRIHDGERGKKFVFGSKPSGAFVLLEPVDRPLPKTARALNDLELSICEGFATGATVVMARPRTVMFCALSAGNLAPVTAALRKVYGYTRRTKAKARKAVDLTIWGDLDASGTGQQAAHRAALESGCYVRLPKFRGGHGDFNDLHAARGLEAVRRTRKVTPDAALAFAKELSEQKLSPQKHLAPIALPDSGGALIVRAPQETGKTEQLSELLSGSGLRVLVVTHRESLAKNLAARLRFESYTDYPAYMLRDIPRLVICFDSLQKLTIGGELPGYDVLVLDESEQVLEHTTGRHIKHKLQNFGVLEHCLKTTPRIICADADAGRLTADTLKRFCPERVITWQRHDHPVAAGRRLRFTHDRDDVLDTLEAETRPTWYATDSLRHSRDVSAHLDDPDALTINSETATTDAALAYLSDPTGQAKQHRRLIASPSVQTGLSDDSEHWQHVVGSFTGHTSTPQDAMQALMRARRVGELTVYAARGRGEAVSVQEALEGAAAVADFEGAVLGQDYGDPNPNYERLSAEVEAQRSRRQAGYKKQLVLKAAKLGYEITYDVARNIAPGELQRRDDRRAALKEAGLERYIRDRVDAERIDAARAEQLDDKYSRSQTEHFALEQYQCRAFYVLPDDVSKGDLADMLRADDYKSLRDKVTRYEGFIEPRAVAEARARGDLDAGVLRGDSKAHLLRHDFHRQLGRVVGLDAETEAHAETWHLETERLEAELRELRAGAAEAQTRRKGELNRQVKRLETNLEARRLQTFGTTYRADSRAVRAFVAWCCKNYRALKYAGLVTASLDNLKAKPLETIGDSLRSCGLAHRHDGKRGAEKSYSLTFGSVSGMCNYSRPRRENWTFAQQTNNKNLVDNLLCKTAVSASPTGLITPPQKPEHDPPALHGPDDLKSWLESGRLDAFGPQKLHVIRQKVADQDAGWLHRLANSRDTGRMLGVVR
jgi:putative DNA primase/helicase